MIELLDSQRRLGIEVYIAPAESISRELNEDYIILDDKVVFRTEQIGQSQRIIIDKVEVDQAKKRFNILLKSSKKLDDLIDGWRNKA